MKAPRITFDCLWVLIESVQWAGIEEGDKWWCRSDSPLQRDDLAQMLGCEPPTVVICCTALEKLGAIKIERLHATAPAKYHVHPLLCFFGDSLSRERAIDAWDQGQGRQLHGSFFKAGWRRPSAADERAAAARDKRQESLLPVGASA